MAFTWIRGRLVVVGYSPDGDSVRFVPDELATVRRLENGRRVRPSERDGSIQLRLDAIDAPETHYQDQAQPLADEARATLLEAVGFSDVRFDDDGTVTASTPDSVPAAVCAALVEVNGRPVALLVTGHAATAHADGDEVDPATVVDVSVNATQTSNGRAYLTLYSSTPEPVRRRFLELAADATGPGSVWAADRSGGFTLTKQADVGPDGQLILPKLFRRATDYLRADTSGTFLGWLRDQGSDDDPVEAAGRRTTLSALVSQDGDRVSLTVPITDLVFVED
ncbi:hypothetical protein [Actinomycetospora soli]|uniref:hypothetical protein n=1 Tax=Actinomycetospora soli TaxID=2893887 RepID=UPI001E2CB411|nr:hypothetical protein [Actinomycetospora soli]MCD2189941.1 hypothetical protein [Actinomycetospora soli]